MNVEHVQVSEKNILKELGVVVSPSTVKKNEAPSPFREEIGRFKQFPCDQVGKKFAFMIIFCGPKVFGKHVINQARLLDFFLFFFATRRKDFRQPRAEFGPIRRPKIATFEDRAASKRILLKIYSATAFRFYSGNAIAVEKVIWPWLRRVFCFILFSDQITSTTFFIGNVLKFPFFHFSMSTLLQQAICLITSF